MRFFITKEKSMKNIRITLIVVLLFLIADTTVYARYSIRESKTRVTYNKKVMLDSCDPATSQVDLDVNNVRARIMNGGDMWWDIFGDRNARYEIPKVAPGERNIHSSFASGLWFGGIDPGGQLRTAGQTYRQQGGSTNANDFWPGPLDKTDGSITADECEKWDAQYTVYQREIDSMMNTGGISDNISSWPAIGDQSKNQERYLAPFFDANGDGNYTPGQGLDYPTLDPAVPNAKPDQMVWWVYNDKGNIHQKYTGAEPIGLEVHALAFAFRTTNEINDMTFYKYKIYNRAPLPLRQMYFGIFTDSDLGNANDDYVGCNMAMVDPDGTGPLPGKPRSFGYTYNADAVDENGTDEGYGTTPPVFGIDFFRGPKDSAGNLLPMSTFMFFTNQGQTGVDADPQNATELYRYLRGIWADGNPLTYGGNGRGGTDPCKYAYPGTTDPDGRPNWTEHDEGNTAGDRRMMHISGPFTLNPGAVNDVILGAVWARASAGDNFASIPLAIEADDKAQTLFDNDFKLPNGPAMPLVRLTALDRKIILTLDETQVTERYNQTEIDLDNLKIPRYKFQGYQIYQLKDNTVTNFQDISLAKLIYQVDIRDSISTIVNKFYNKQTDNVQAQVMVEGTNRGLRHTFDVTTDAFAFSTDNSIVNNKTYYFAVVPYAYADSVTDRTKYLPSRNSNTVFSVTANKALINNYNNNRITFGVPITRVEGAGNGGSTLDLSPEATDNILQNNVGREIVYQPSAGPITIRVYDPAKVPNMNFKLIVSPDFKSYTLYNADDNNVLMTSDITYDSANTLNDNEQVAEIRSGTSKTKLGFTINVDNTIPAPSQEPDINNNAFLGASETYSDIRLAWLSPFPSTGEPTWTEPNLQADPKVAYTAILGGGYAPYKVGRTLALSPGLTPVWDLASKNLNRFDSISSVDLVYTADESKWSQCIVIESGNNAGATEANRTRMNLRAGDIGLGMGRSRFPGYAINVETGERLNVFFAENSADIENNGRDMLFNPTSDRDPEVVGGRHFVYVARSRYDSCNKLWTQLFGTTGNNPNATVKRQVYAGIGWVTLPVLRNNATLLGTDLKVRLRVAKPYSPLVVDGSNAGAPSYRFSTNAIVTSYSDNASEKNKNALDLIRIVPNPYYANSSFEKTTNDFKVRFTNLPSNAVIHIYTANGVLVRKFTKADPGLNYLDWDLQNADRLPIASGMYIIHINAVGYGEKTLKWLAVMRPLDFENF
jgi:hypothetical protein